MPLENAICEEAFDYHKKKHTLRLITKDGGEYLFDCKNESNARSLMQAMNEEADKISAMRSNYNNPPSTSGVTSSYGSAGRTGVIPPRPPPDNLGPISPSGPISGNLSVPLPESPTPSQSKLMFDY